jgi:hypothetical protein
MPQIAGVALAIANAGGVFAGLDFLGVSLAGIASAGTVLGSCEISAIQQTAQRKKSREPEPQVSICGEPGS